jgi:ABC-type sugar transport system ATPase subunit
VSVAIAGLVKTYPSRGRANPPVVALHGIELAAIPGELVVVVGPSGSGKTTLLRCVAGLEAPDGGRIEVGGRDVTTVAPGDRDVAMVFQEHALYPHLSVQANISFGLRARKLPAPEITARVVTAAGLLGLTALLARRPGELSGGERQRVALARAIVREPAAFLMDEPLSNLDAELRAQTRVDIRALQRELDTTMIYVTHDQIEAMTMGDRVAVLRGGHVEQVDAPMVIYQRPATAFVARFFGTPPMNLFPASLSRGPNGASLLGLRPERIRLVTPAEGRLSGRVSLVEPIGSETIVHVDVDGHRFLVKVSPDSAVSQGGEVGLAFADAHLYGFAGPEGEAIV